jgi:DNA invertase Pin-like site-specific DNA recombinase
MKNAYSYLRVSGKGQIEGDGFDRQRDTIQTYADQNGIKITKEFREMGVSGTKDWDDREAFVEMMTLLLSNGTTTVLVENLSRLARDLMVQESILSDFKRKGLTLISVSEPDTCSDDPSRVFMRQVLGAFHQYDKALLVAKLRGARKRKRDKTGTCEGRKPYGFHDGEQPILERMKALRAGRMAVDTIALTLNNESIRTRSGKLWYGATVNKILKAA